MERIEVDLLSGETNRAIVQLPSRKFPGVVVQGDSLSILAEDARRIALALEDSNLPIADEAQDLANRLRGLLDHYAQVLAAHRIPLPFNT